MKCRLPLFLATAFSLVEVTIAMGIIAFGLVAILGVLPVAFTTSRASITQTRATGIADTVFAGLRAQPFTPRAVIGAGLIYPEPDPLPALPPAKFTVDLANRSAGDPDVVLFAVLNETEPVGTTDTRRLRFVASSGDMDTVIRQSGGAASGYELTFRFDNQPAGMSAAKLANRVTVIVRAANGAASTASQAGPGDSYRFATIIANRGAN